MAARKRAQSGPTDMEASLREQMVLPSLQEQHYMALGARLIAASLRAALTAQASSEAPPQADEPPREEAPPPKPSEVRRVIVPLEPSVYARLLAVAGGKAAMVQLVARLIRQHLEHGEQTRAALANLKAQGVALGQKPMEGAAVLRAQELRRAGRTLRQIAQALTDEGFPTKRGGRWGPGNVALLVQLAPEES